MDVASLSNDLADIYALNAFDRVSYAVRREDGMTALTVTAEAKPADVARFRAGLTLDNDFDGDGTYLLSVEYTSAPLDRFGSEFRGEAVLGERSELSLELFKLLGTGQHLFIAPRLGVAVRNVPLYREDGFQTGTYRASYAEGQMDIGWQFGSTAELRIGYQRGMGEARLRDGIGSPETLDLDIGQIVASAGLDTLDDAFFPTQGTRISTRWIHGLSSLGAADDFQTLEVATGHAWSRGADTLILQVEGATSLDGTVPLESLFRVGGLFSLSGYREEELTGEAFALGRAIYRRRLNSANPAAFGIPLYVGGSIELGNAWADPDFASVSDLNLAGSVFLAADSFLGPVYLGYGLSETGRQSLYLFLGRPF